MCIDGHSVDRFTWNVTREQGNTHQPEKMTLKMAMENL